MSTFDTGAGGPTWADDYGEIAGFRQAWFFHGMATKGSKVAASLAHAFTCHSPRHRFGDFRTLASGGEAVSGWGKLDDIARLGDGGDYPDFSRPWPEARKR